MSPEFLTVDVVLAIHRLHGNKRAGLAAALTFLDLNGIAIDHSSDLLYDATMAVAEGRLSKEDLGSLLRGLSPSTG